MKDSIRNKLDRLKDRFDEIEALLSDAEIIADQTRFRELSKEYAEIEEVVKSFNRFLAVSEDLDAAREIQKDPDPEIRGFVLKFMQAQRDGRFRGGSSGNTDRKNTPQDQPTDDDSASDVPGPSTGD